MEVASAALAVGGHLPKGNTPFGLLCEAKIVVCYTLYHCRENAVAAGGARAFGRQENRAVLRGGVEP